MSAPLEVNQTFTVKESVLINIISGILFTAMTIGVFITRNFERGESATSFVIIYLFLALGAIYCFTNAYRQRVILYISNQGIYYKGQLVTNWTNFVHAYIMQEEYVVSNNSSGLSDKFNIMVTFFNPAAGGNYVWKMRMSGSQDKSEFQIIEAIELFSGKDLSTHIY